MFTRNNSNEPSARPKRTQTGLSFIGPEVVVAGSLTTSAQIQIDGKIDGDLRCDVMSQGESGVVAGDIHADEARIAGRVEGKVNARNVMIESTARILGDVTYEVISINAGAQIDGRLARRAALESAPLLVATPIEPMPTKGVSAAGVSTAGIPAGNELFPAGGKALAG
jgi:cytoskeletal protein CcmA (bactofilin family)